MRLALLVLLLLLGAACSKSPPAGAAESTGTVVRYVTDKPFADVVEELEFAITERNFRITGYNKVGSAMRERGYENFPDMEVIHFCSLAVAREVLEYDPGYIAMMPCRITVHAGAGQTVISVILLPENHPDARVVAFARRMNSTLREIAAFALEKDAPVTAVPATAPAP
ncbi:MAG: DUF302 domain-containing protein [Gammaproteobacteria bacterium]|nr:DUF302 domain-containing protein [Gammaproteobacteria bacterium]MCG3146294.1 hypothetical protein [Gammaproteobacteria bacterium]